MAGNGTATATAAAAHTSASAPARSSAPQYLIASKPGCTWCDRAKDLLTARGLGWTELVCASAAEAHSALARHGLVSDMTTFPQIAVNGRVIGGYDALAAAEQAAEEEPLLVPNPGRFTPFPIEHHDLWDMYKKAVASFWTADEVNLGQDAADFARLTPEERHFVKHVLAFFASSDGIVMENLAANFGVEVQAPEARQFYAYQIFNESIHSESYGLLIDALIADPTERADLFQAIRTVPAVEKKAAWALKWLDPAKSFAERLVAFVCVEGILFSGSFCAIYWLKQRGVLPGLCLSNQFISRDEGLHQEFGMLLYSKLRRKLPAATVTAIVTEAVENEKEFITDAIPCRMVGMNDDLMKRYIEFVADRILVGLGAPRHYGADNPFPWMELISLSGKTNFFEHFPSEYQRAGVMAKAEDQVFGLDEDF
jgi:ribonucleotide reductase beta subunit family protein with ferritin-like domain